MIVQVKEKKVMAQVELSWITKAVIFLMMCAKSMVKNNLGNQGLKVYVLKFFGMSFGYFG